MMAARYRSSHLPYLTQRCRFTLFHFSDWFLLYQKAQTGTSPGTSGACCNISESADPVNLMFPNLQCGTSGSGSAVFNLDPVTRTEAVCLPGMNPQFPQRVIITNPHFSFSYLQHKRLDCAGANCNGMHDFPLPFLRYSNDSFSRNTVFSIHG
jgi:hypothetical protein